MEIPMQRSYEQLPTPALEVALERANETYWTLEDQLASARVTIAALKNVLMERNGKDR